MHPDSHENNLLHCLKMAQCGNHLASIHRFQFKRLCKSEELINKYWQYPALQNLKINYEH